MGNLNYPDYSGGFGGYGRAPKKPDEEMNYAQGIVGGGASGAAAGSSAGPYGALIGAVAGAGLGAYGAYQQGEQSDQDYAQQMAAWEADQERQRLAEEEAKRRAILERQMGAAGYARGLQSSRDEGYRGHAARIGL